MGILKRDSRFKPLEKTGIPFYDRVMEIIPSLNRKLPSPLTKLLVFRYYVNKYKSPLYPQIHKLKVLRFKSRLHISKKIQELLYYSTSKSRKFTYFYYLFTGLLVGLFFSDQEFRPGHEGFTLDYMLHPRIHWLLPYLLEDVHIKDSPDYFKKDNLSMAFDRALLKGIEDKELDPLSWMVLGARFSSMQEAEFSYLAYQMAHFKDHEHIGGNSMQPLEGMESARFFTS